MSRAPVLLGAALAAALSGFACTKAKSTAAGARLRQPSSVAAFRGKTIADPAHVKPYLAVANQSRNDLSIVDGVTDVAVPAPIQLRTLVLTVESRPTLVAAASLGDGATPGSVEDPKDPSTAQPDLLVAVASGDSVLQLVETWNTANLVHSDPLETPTRLAVDLGHDVLALAVVPSAPGEARIAAALADHRVAVVTYVRGAGGSVAPVLPPAISAPLPFQPEAIAAMPGDAAQTALYAATRDPIATDANGDPMYGVEEISIPGLVPIRALVARGPTRLVAAARLQERISGSDGSSPPPGNPLPGSAANDQTAFAGKTSVARVYAVLDESGCGPRKRIDCGVVTLDADPAVASGTEAVPHDDQFMPYRAPMRIPGRPLALSVSGPPAKPPPFVEGEPNFETDAALIGFMRVYSAGVARATTAVAAVPSDDGNVYFLDLGRFELATSTPVVSSKNLSTAEPAYTTPRKAADGTACTDTKPECKERRLWLRTGKDGAFVSGAGFASEAITVTPGFTQDQDWSVVYQGLLAPAELYARAGEAGEQSPGVPWVAMQLGAGGSRFNEVVRLWDPALGVRTGDILVIKARAVGCTGTPSGISSDAENQFEVGVTGLLAPDVARYPGGAVTVAARAGTDPDDTAAWAQCFAALQGQTAGIQVATRLVVSVRAGGYVLTGKTAQFVDRPAPNEPFTLQYQDEDVLAASCPLDAWDWRPPVPACDEGSSCRTSCEALARARKVRRTIAVSVDCNTSPTATAACDASWQTGNPSTTPAPVPPETKGTQVFPLVISPVALAFTFDVQPKDAGGDTTPLRDLRLVISTKSNVSPLQARGNSTSPYQASGITSFDRSPWTDPLAGYRFLVSYPADFVLDTTAGQSGAPSGVIR